MLWITPSTCSPPPRPPPRPWPHPHPSWSVFSQDHCAKHLLGWDVDNTTHDAAMDAIKSIRLFNGWQQLQANPAAWEHAQQTLMGAPPSQSFARRHPSYEGVCMGNRKTCTCGAPFFS